MATRSLTNTFERLRERAKSSGSRRRSRESSRERLTNAEDVRLDMREAQLPPEWVDIVESIEQNLSDVNSRIRSLQKLHNSRLKVTFGEDEAEQEREIEITTQEITRLLRKSETNLKRIATVGNDRGSNLAQQERVVRLNVMRNLATQMQSLSKQFRHAQKDFLFRLKGQEEMGDNFFPDSRGDTKQPLSFEQALDRGFTDAQMQQLEELESHSTEREKEIIHVAQSINELASLFRELNVLVIEQGTVLDRIDYNVEQALVKVKSGTAELVKADEWSKKARTMKCIMLLVLTIIILTIILIVKHTNFNDDDDK